MKYPIFILLVILGLISCQGNSEQKPAEDAQMSQPGPAQTPEEIKKMQEEAAKSGVEVSQSELAGMSNSTIIGSNVNMRSDASIKSEKIGTFENNEKVEVIESLNVQNEGEAILSKAITVKGSGGTANLPKGKAVVIEDYYSDKNTYMVSYEDPKKGKLTAEIDASAALTIIYATWFRVKRQSGEVGWVLGKFLKTN